MSRLVLFCLDWYHFFTALFFCSIKCSLVCLTSFMFLCIFSWHKEVQDWLIKVTICIGWETLTPVEVVSSSLMSFLSITFSFFFSYISLFSHFSVETSCFNTIEVDSFIYFEFSISDEAGRPPEFKHITKGRKRN